MNVNTEAIAKALKEYSDRIERRLAEVEAERDGLRKERDVAYEHLREWARIGGGLRFCACRYMTTRTGLMHEKACPTAAALEQEREA